MPQNVRPWSNPKGAHTGFYWAYWAGMWGLHACTNPAMPRIARQNPIIYEIGPGLLSGYSCWSLLATSSLVDVSDIFWDNFIRSNIDLALTGHLLQKNNQPLSTWYSPWFFPRVVFYPWYHQVTQSQPVYNRPHDQDTRFCKPDLCESTEKRRTSWENRS